MIPWLIMALGVFNSRIRALFPIPYEDCWVGHSCRSILTGMRSAGAEMDLTVPTCHPKSKEPFILRVFPNKACRFVEGKLAPAARWLVRRRFLGRLKVGDVAYLWLNSPPPLVKAIKSRGGIVAREMINCTAAFRQEQFQRAYDLLKWPNSSIESADVIAGERAELQACDVVFCPNPFVLKSVMAYGIPQSACLPCSYGWSRGRLHAHPHSPLPHKGLNVLFVGTVGVRKGVPWLLEAWSRARIDGTLMLAGPIDKEMTERASALLRQPSVKVLGYVEDIASLYDQADVFVFPTWEEGGPMVTFEAMAHGLPSIVTPVGTAGVATPREAIIVDPGSVDSLVDALVRLAADSDLRRELGNCAFETAKSYEWQAVGERRLLALTQALTSPATRVSQASAAV